MIFVEILRFWISLSNDLHCTKNEETLNGKFCVCAKSVMGPASFLCASLQLNAQSITENLSILYVAWHGFIIAESPRKLKLVLQRKNEIPVKIFSNR